LETKINISRKKDSIYPETEKKIKGGWEKRRKDISDSGGIRTHALADWCLKPAP
jgi:hypothetical protein